MRILHICAALTPFGGVTEFVAQLALHQQQQGANVCIATLGDGQSSSIATAQERGVNVRRFPFSFPKCLYFSWGMLRGLEKIIREMDVVHIHSNWTFPVWWGSWLALCFDKKLVMSPHGALDPVRRRHSGWKKRCVGWLDRWCLRHAHAIHATSASEANWVRGYLGKNFNAKIKIIPSGICTPPDNIKRTHLQAKKRVVYLGRLHPLKGMDFLLESWSKLASSHGDWELVLVGPDEQGTCENLKRQMKVDSIRMAGAVYGGAKWELLASADIFVLPSRSENFGIVVGEALACGVPVVVTKGAPWKKIEEVGCGYWVDVSVEGIADGLSCMMRMNDEQRREMGAKGKAWIQQEFAWERISCEMLNLYRNFTHE